MGLRMTHRFCAAALGLALAAYAPAQSSGAKPLKTGKEIWDAGCAGCHGADGRGALESTIGFEKPDTYPDFTRCDQTTPEDHWEWKSVIRDGGPSRGFSPIMPSFSGALTSGQIDAVMQYMRGFCKESGWPRGDLNLPLAMVTEKAFPEDEEVVITSINAQGDPGFTSEFIHEQRFGKNNQIEVSVPVQFTRPQPGLWYGGFGDIGLGLKRVLFSNLRSGTIVSVLGEAIFPTGNKQHGLGTGVPTFETDALFGQLFPRKFFVQAELGADLPIDTAQAPQTVYARANVGKFFNSNAGLGRLWAPMFEVLTTRDLMTGMKTDLDAMPEFQVTLSRRQHVRLGVGLRIPATNTAGRQKQAMFYLLWDWQDGKLWEGW